MGKIQCCFWQDLVQLPRGATKWCVCSILCSILPSGSPVLPPGQQKALAPPGFISLHQRSKEEEALLQHVGEGEVKLLFPRSPRKCLLPDGLQLGYIHIFQLIIIATDERCSVVLKPFQSYSWSYRLGVKETGAEIPPKSSGWNVSKGELPKGKIGLFLAKERGNKRLERGILIFIMKDFRNLLRQTPLSVSRTNFFFSSLKPETSRQGRASQGKVRSGPKSWGRPGTAVFKFIPF